MLNLLILFLFMTTVKEPDIELQPVQQPIVEQMPTVIPWRTTRPYNVRTATMNRYLDSSTFDWQKSISSAGNGVLDASVTYTKVWQYSFEWTNGFIIPTDWTYTITLASFVWWASNPTSWIVIVSMTHEDKNSTTINVPQVAIPREACDWDGNSWSYTYNFKKWDTITFAARNWTNQTLTIRITATITKIS